MSRREKWQETMSQSLLSGSCEQNDKKRLRLCRPNTHKKRCRRKIIFGGGGWLVELIVVRCMYATWHLHRRIDTVECLRRISDRMASQPIIRVRNPLVSQNPGSELCTKTLNRQLWLSVDGAKTTHSWRDLSLSLSRGSVPCGHFPRNFPGGFVENGPTRRFRLCGTGTELIFKKVGLRKKIKQLITK